MKDIKTILTRGVNRRVREESRRQGARQLGDFADLVSSSSRRLDASWTPTTNTLQTNAMQEKSDSY